MMSDENTKLRLYELIDQTLIDHQTSNDSVPIKHILTGPGGTGKTTFLRELARKYTDEKINVTIICPTHKSIRNITDDNIDITCKTYCSFFHCNFDILNVENKLECNIECCKHNNHITLQQTIDCLDKRNKFITYNTDILIIEECSMFTHMYYQILQHVVGIKFILFIGDSNQIPPINNECKLCDECIFTVFKTSIPKSIFKEQKRHDNNVSTKLQSFIKLISQCDSINKKKINHILEELFEIQSLDKVLPIVSPIITYNVKRCEMINFLLVKGRLEINVNDYVTVDRGSIESLPIGTICKVIKIVDDDYICYQLQKGFKFKVYTVISNNVEYTINTIHPLEKEDYITYCREFRDKLSIKMRYGINVLIKEHLTEFSHAYSVTAHKAQGQTYQTSYIDYKNILGCKDTEMVIKLLYSAISRAKNRIVLITLPTYFKVPTDGVIITDDFL